MLSLKDKHSEIINRAKFCTVELRPYQQEALENILRLYLEEGRNRLMLQVATGGGKTVIFAYLSFLLNVPSLILAHSEELVQQAIDKIRLVWPQADIGRVQGNFNELGHQITVATIQTLSIEKRFRQLFPDRAALNRIGLIVIDEAHRAHSATYRKLLTHFNLLSSSNKAAQFQKVTVTKEGDKPLLLGVTATPERSDKAWLGDIFTDFAYRWTIKDGIRQGYLCDLRGYVLQFENDKFEKVKINKGDGDYIPSQLEKAINRVARSEAIVQAWKEQAKGRPTIVFCVSIRHAVMLKRVFSEAGVKTGVLYSGMEPEARRQVLEDLKAGQLQVVTNCLILAEGFDCPPVSCVVIARPTRSRSLYAQMLGRGTRLSPETGKANLLVLDVADIFHHHNLNAPLTLGEVIDPNQEQGTLAAGNGNIESVGALLEQAEQGKAGLLAEKGKKGSFDAGWLLDEEELGREVSGGEEFDPLADQEADLAEARLHWVVGLGGYTLALPQPRNVIGSRHYVLVVRREGYLNRYPPKEELIARRVGSKIEPQENTARGWRWDIVHVVQHRQFDADYGRHRWVNSKEKLVFPARSDGFESGALAIREAENYAFRITNKYYNLAKLKGRNREAVVAEGVAHNSDRNVLPMLSTPAAKEATTPAQLATLRKLRAGHYRRFQSANGEILSHPADLSQLTKREAAQLIEDLITAQVRVKLVGEDATP